LHATVQASSEYFDLMKIPIVDGRAFTRTDHEQPGDAVIVSEAFARNYWPGSSALGRKIRPNQNGDWYTVVGVVGDVRETGLTEPKGQTVYFPMLTLSKGAYNTPRTMTYFLRTSAAPATYKGAVFARMADIDRDLPLIDMQSLSEVVQRATARQQFTSTLLLSAAAIAMMLSALGIYAVVGYSVHQRVREIGVRIAVGASQRHITRMILREALAVTTTGIVAGLVGGVFVGRAARALLFEVQEHDPLTLVMTTVAIVTTVIIASWIPARRAAAVEPVEALRVE
jgi:predicted lysophospholipase L1 biosynthesis ABC-type transport system permease subunit